MFEAAGRESSLSFENRFHECLGHECLREKSRDLDRRDEKVDEQTFDGPRDLMAPEI